MERRREEGPRVRRGEVGTGEEEVWRSEDEVRRREQRGGYKGGEGGGSIRGSRAVCGGVHVAVGGREGEEAE